MESWITFELDTASQQKIAHTNFIRNANRTLSSIFRFSLNYDIYVDFSFSWFAPIPRYA
jgi:hypothetical protein